MIKYILDVGIPILAAITAAMTANLNYELGQIDGDLKQRHQALTERLSVLDAEVKKSSEVRSERESNQDYSLRIYDMVVNSIEQKSAVKQEAAKAFIVVMVDEPLRSSLLNVLKEGGASKQFKAEVSKIISAEERFTNPTVLSSERTQGTNQTVQTAQAGAKVAPRDITEMSPGGPAFKWESWDVDIFWCGSSGEKAKALAESAGRLIVAEGALGRIRIRELPDSINSRPDYGIKGFVIRRNETEMEIAEALKSISEKTLKENKVNDSFEITRSSQDTKEYVSAFFCPNK